MFGGLRGGLPDGLRAFSSGCAALTGVEAISNGVPAFRKPKSRNAATTLVLLGTIAVTMLMSDRVPGQQDASPVRRGSRRPVARPDGQPVGDDYPRDR